MSFTIDFFELMFLAESVIPDRPIARSTCFDDFSDRHYHKMTPDQRVSFFNHVKNCNGFSLDNEQCRHFYARFNPDNQYLVSCFHQGKVSKFECYLYNGEYHSAKDKRVNKEYIKEVIKL